MSILIVGGNSRLSSRIISKYEIKYLTTRRECKNPNQIFLDLRDISEFKIPNDVKNCLIIGGPVSYSQSNEGEKFVKDIHEKQIPNLVSRLLKKDIYTVYVSSNMVLGKLCKDRSEKAFPMPNINYGKMKYLCEKMILDKSNQLNKKNKIAILRLTKNISHDTSPFRDWIINYRLSKKIYAFNDLYISPINYESSANVLMKLIELQEPGIFHFSGECDKNYFEICCEINKILESQNRKQLRVVSVKSFEKGINLEDTGNITRLDMKRSTAKLDILPMTINDISKYFITLLDKS